MRPHTPKADLTPGLWYLAQDYAPFYTVVSLTPFALGPQAGRLGVWLIDHEGNYSVDDFADDQFIARVPSPFLVDQTTSIL